MKQFAESNALYQAFDKFMEDCGEDMCVTVYVVRNPLMPLLPLLQRVQHQNKQSRPKLTTVVPTICRDPSHKDSDSIPLSRIGLHMLLIDKKGMDAAVETLRAHHQTPRHYAHDCHQAHCEQPRH